MSNGHFLFDGRWGAEFILSLHRVPNLISSFQWRAERRGGGYNRLRGQNGQQNDIKLIKKSANK